MQKLLNNDVILNKQIFGKSCDTSCRKAMGSEIMMQFLSIFFWLELKLGVDIEALLFEGTRTGKAEHPEKVSVPKQQSGRAEAQGRVVSCKKAGPLTYVF